MRKPVLFLLMLLLCVCNTFAVVVQSSAPPVQDDGNAFISGLVFLIAIIIVLIIILGVIVMKMLRYIREMNRRDKSLLYNEFCIHFDLANQQKDSAFKKRNWLTLFLTWKRSPVLIKTPDNRFVKIGLYEGEMVTKTDFKLIAISNKTGFFDKKKQIIALPYKITSILNKKYSRINELIINCEAIDEGQQNDYIIMPVVRNVLTNEIIDFTDIVSRNYKDIFALRTMINESLEEGRNSVNKAIEINPTLNYERRNPDK